MLALTCCFISPGESQVQTPQCRIQKCTTDFVSLTSHLNPSLDGFDTEFCKALRAYSGCTHRTAKSCRGNLVFHSAMLGISDLMSQRNCSKDGPTSSTHTAVAVEPCNYHSRFHHHQAAPTATGTGVPGAPEHSRPNYLFCGLFGDPHLRTFKDQFQTCKVEGAWPLIDNNYLSVQVTNVPVVQGSSATATNKVSCPQEWTQFSNYSIYASELEKFITPNTDLIFVVIYIAVPLKFQIWLDEGVDSLPGTEAQAVVM